MKDSIKELCMKKRIKPLYTNNKLTVLSGGTQNGMPVLRIHKIFKNCSRKTALAIVNYYLDIENRENYRKQIQTDAQRYLGTGEYKIAPLSDSFINAFILNYHFREETVDRKTELTERSIFTLMQNDFSGSHPRRITDGIIEVNDDNMIELDIVVDK